VHFGREAGWRPRRCTLRCLAGHCRPLTSSRRSRLSSSLAELRARLPELTLHDQRRLAKRADAAAAQHDGTARQRAISRLEQDVLAARRRAQARQRAVPAISYPAELPVSQRKDEIARLISDHQVVILAGETGSGKTTQLPKICLELGRGVTGQIGHTQPRRIAARAVAERIAAELGTELGTAVGYKVRFADTSSDNTLVKVMTDGILLTELQHDRDLLRYDTLIIDEAHERSLNIDFILGYLKQLLPRRPDLKVIITSATIDPLRFSAHFAAEPADGSRPGSDRAGSAHAGAPVIEVSGRTFPVEIRYRPLADPEDRDAEPQDQAEAICAAVGELAAEGPGDVLVFLSGEREIRDTADALAARPGLEVLPLYGRLSADEQHRVFRPHRGRRVVLATNVAETSLTVPGIRYVIDAGTARISRYSRRTKVQRLPIEPVSQASARQRAGRCGRTSGGICVRLYSEEDFASRRLFTEPEILRTGLASVILRMAALDLGPVADFPFVDPPDSRQVADGIRLLEELGAVSQDRSAVRLTPAGRQLARIPADPRLGRMILAAGQHGCADEVLVIAAALAIVDPRERPAESRSEADAQHARFTEPGSDFLSFLVLWDYLRARQRELSSSAFRRMCRREYLHYLRVREWQDVHAQLAQATRDLGIAAAGEPAPLAAPDPAGHRAAGRQVADGQPASRFPAELADRVHRSLLAGLLSHIGMRDPALTERGRRRGPAEFCGARSARFAIFPDSALASRPPQWVVAAELVETSRLWARIAASIQPEWAESLAGHLVHRSYSEPRWDARRGAAMATEKVSLYGLPIVPGRTVSYGRVDPAGARELFIGRALVEGDWQTQHRFFRHNKAMLARAQELERKARRRGIAADDPAWYDFYDRRIPASVTSARHFDAWWKRERAVSPALLDFPEEELLRPGAGHIRPGDFPDHWGEFALHYEFAPGDPQDGVTVQIPLARLNQVSADEFSWQVPGLRGELVTEMIRSLPKPLRRALVPAPETAVAVLPRLGPPHGDLRDALAAELLRHAGVMIPRAAWDLSRLPAYLRISFEVTDSGRVRGTGKDLAAMRAELQPQLQAALAAATAGLTRTGVTDWDFGPLPAVVAGGPIHGYLALADEGQVAELRVFSTAAEAAEAMWQGTRRLLLRQVPSGVRAAARQLPVTDKLALSRHPYPDAGALADDCAACAADQLIAGAGGPPGDGEAFARLADSARHALPAASSGVLRTAARVLGEAHQAEAALAAARSAQPAAALADIGAQLSGLIYPGFITATGSERLPDLVRYLRAVSRRLEKLPESPSRDAERMAAVQRVTEAYREVLAALPPAARSGEAAAAIRWMIEELRVSLFAQALGTREPVSEQRIRRALDRLQLPESRDVTGRSDRLAAPA
jgi:ATP-dependent helicase HrpA